VSTKPEFRIGNAERLFAHPSLAGSYCAYDVSADGRFVVVGDVADEGAAQRKPAIRITENWHEEFRDRE
jgi:hypothetical protein